MVPPALVVVAVFVVYGGYALSRWDQLLTAGYDLGIFDQAVRQYSRFQAPLVPLKGADFNLLGDHFHPILMLLAPLYWIWDDARVLLLCQAALLAASCVPVWRVCRRRFPVGVALLLLVGYAFGWPLQGLVDFDFHEVAFAVPLLACALDALDDRRDRYLIVSCLALLLVREDMGAVVAVIGVVRAFRQPRAVGIGLIILGIAAFVVTLWLVVPFFAGDRYAYWQYDALRFDSLPEAAQTIAGLPRTILLPIQKTQTLLALLSPLLLLPLLSRFSLIAIPIVAERFLSDRESLWTTEFHYNAPVWAIIFIAGVDGLGIVRVTTRGRRVPSLVAFAVAAVPLTATLVLPAFASGTYPLGRLVTGDAFARTAHMQDQRAAIASLPRGTCVTVDDRLAPPLTRTNRTTIPGVTTPSEPDFVVLDLEHPVPTGGSGEVSSTEAVHRLERGGYTRSAQFGSVVVLRSDDYAGPTPACAP